MPRRARASSSCCSSMCALADELFALGGCGEVCQSSHVFCLPWARPYAMKSGGTRHAAVSCELLCAIDCSLVELASVLRALVQEKLGT